MSTKSILYSGTTCTFLKLNTLAGLVAMLGHGTVIGTPHFTPPCHVPMWFYLGGVESLPNFEVTVTF